MLQLWAALDDEVGLWQQERDEDREAKSRS